MGKKGKKGKKKSKAQLEEEARLAEEAARIAEEAARSKAAGSGLLLSKFAAPRCSDASVLRRAAACHSAPLHVVL